jgi:hypothetical protein
MIEYHRSRKDVPINEPKPVAQEPIRTMLLEPWLELASSGSIDKESFNITLKTFQTNYNEVYQNYKELNRKYELERKENEKLKKKWKILEENAKKLK